MRIRFRDLSFGSQVKLGAMVALTTGVMSIPLLVLFYIAIWEESPIPMAEAIFVTLVASLPVALVFAAGIMLLHLVGLLALRLLPWRGPVLKAEVANPDAVRIFE